MKVSRLFLSAQQNPASGNATPSGIAAAIVAPIAPLGAAVVFPGSLTGDRPVNVVLVVNKGAGPLSLAYHDGVSTLPDSVPQTPSRRQVVEVGKSTLLTDVAGLAVSYWGGPFTAAAGQFHYSVLEDTSSPDHPGAAVTL